MKKLALVFLATLTVGASQPVPQHETTKTYTADELYSISTTVSDIDKISDFVICTDFSGNEWAFYGVEDWAVGDIAALTMSNNNTLEIEDDEIITATYCGWVF